MGRVLSLCRRVDADANEKQSRRFVFHGRQDRSGSLAICKSNVHLFHVHVGYKLQLVYLNAFWPPCTFVVVAAVCSVSLLVSYKWLEETKGVVLDNVGLYNRDAAPLASDDGVLQETHTMLLKDLST